MAYKYTIARQLPHKQVITNKGEEIGNIVDVIVDEKTGKLETLLVEVEKDSRIAGKLKKKGKVIEIPYSAVLAVSDVFIIDERGLPVE